MPTVQNFNRLRVLFCLVLVLFLITSCNEWTSDTPGPEPEGVPPTSESKPPPPTKPIPIEIPSIIIKPTPDSPTPAPKPTPAPTPAPAEFRVTSLDIEPLEASVSQVAVITATVANTGTGQGTYVAVLSVDGVDVETKEVAIAPATSEVITFTLVKDSPGTYQIGVGNFRHSLEVKEKPAEETETPQEEPEEKETTQQPQLFEESLKPGAAVGRTFSIFKVLEAGEEVSCFVEIFDPETHAADYSTLWHLKVLTGDGEEIYSWQGDYLGDNNYQFSFTAVDGGKHLIKVIHHSNYGKSLSIRIYPMGWSTGE